MDLKVLKKRVHDQCVLIVEQRINALNKEMIEIQASANEETKSLAGDKYETTRAIILLEQEKLAEQLDEAQKHQQSLGLIDQNKSNESAELGALIRTGDTQYYLSASLGQIKIAQNTVFAISPISPIGQVLLGKKLEDVATFNRKEIEILEIC
jgi:transcription elongation GreA/GreB family factor